MTTTLETAGFRDVYWISPFGRRAWGEGNGGEGALGKVCTRAWATPILFLVFRSYFTVHVVHEDDREAFLLDGLTCMA